MRALVVGSTKATGEAVVRALEPHKVVGVARTGADINLDLMTTGAVDELISRVWENGSPDIIVHVMGGSTGIKDPLSSAWGYEKVWRLNLGVALDINRAFLPAMVSKGWGRIVHFSSNAVKLAIGHSPYASAKAAVEGYVRTIGKEFGPKGVVITAVRPGPFDTGSGFLYTQDEAWTQRYQESYVPMKRWGRQDELAGVVSFLCSDKSSYMAGAIVDVDGGMR